MYMYTIVADSDVDELKDEVARLKHQLQLAERKRNS